MKTNAIVFLVLGALIVLAIISIMKSNKIEKAVMSGTSNKRVIESEPIVTPQQNAESTTTQRKDVSAQELANAVREKINKQQVKELNITFQE